MKTLEECLATVSDPRRTQGRRYDLVHALLYCVLAMSVGATSYRKIHVFIDAHWGRLMRSSTPSTMQRAVHDGVGNDHKYGKLGLDAATLEATAAQIQSRVPLGRFGTPQELATTVLHLAVPESAFIVGTEAIVDGGMSQH